MGKQCNPKKAFIGISIPVVCGLLSMLLPFEEGQTKISWCLLGNKTIPLTVENEEITLRMNTSGLNWDLEFVDVEGSIFIKQHEKTLLEGYFMEEDGFALWEEDILNQEEFAIIEAVPRENPELYFCSVNGESFLYLKQVENSKFCVLLYTPEDNHISQEKAEEAFQRLLITAENPSV